MGRAWVGWAPSCRGLAAVLEAPALVAGLDDVAVVSEAVEQRGRHLRIAKHARPFAEGQIGGDDDRSSLVKPADEMEQQLPAGLSERQIAEFVEDHEVHAREIIGEPSLAAGAGFGLELVDEIDGGEEAPARSCPHRAEGRRVCHVGPLASARLHVVKSSSVTSEATLNRYE